MRRDRAGQLDTVRSGDVVERLVHPARGGGDGNFHRGGQVALVYAFVHRAFRARRAR